MILINNPHFLKMSLKNKRNSLTKSPDLLLHPQNNPDYENLLKSFNELSRTNSEQESYIRV
jgi:hypothetical protein